MPELPEVETARRSMERACKGKRLVQVVSAQDSIVYDQAAPDAVAKALLGAKVLGSGRKGKYFWLVLNRRPWPVFHLGMTGDVKIRKAGQPWDGIHLQGLKKNRRDDQPKFSRLQIITDDKTEILITDPRRFGRIRLAQDPLSEKPISLLGADPLERFPSSKSLYLLLQKRKAPIKAILLDQKIFAGVGNWVADEVLFQARLSPKRLGSSLSLKDVTHLRIKLISILKLAVKLHADSNRYPKSWLFNLRWSRGSKKKTPVTASGHTIVFQTIGGRTSAWVPELQK